MRYLHPTQVHVLFSDINCLDDPEHMTMLIGLLGGSHYKCNIGELYSRFFHLFFYKEEEWNCKIYKTFNNDNKDRLSSMSELECMVDYLIKLFKNENDAIKYIISDESNWFTPRLKDLWGKYLTRGLVCRIHMYLQIKSRIYDLGNHLHVDKSPNMCKERKEKIIRSLFTFYEQYPNFNSKKYRIYNNIKISEIDSIEHWVKNRYNNNYLKGKYNYRFEQIIIVPHIIMNNADGGAVVMYTLAKLLDLYGECSRIERVPQFVLTIKSPKIKCEWTNISHLAYYRNNIYNSFAVREDWVNEREKTLVIYCEGSMGESINAKYAVRWMLSELGKNVKKERVQTWNPNELVYFFNREERFTKEPHKVGNIYKELSILTINEMVWTWPCNKRNEWCYTIRKGIAYHGSNFPYIHPDGSYELGQKIHSLYDHLMIFSTHRYFLCYDPLTFYGILSVLLDCVTVIYPLKNKTKQEWLQMTAIGEYINEHNEPVYGIAYGMDEIEEAKKSLPKAKEQWKRILNYYYNKHIPSFINDINNINQQTNIIKNIW